MDYLRRFFKGIDKKEYEEAKDLITEANRRAVKVLAILAMAILSVLFVISFFNTYMANVRWAYFGLIVGMGILFLVNQLATGKSYRIVEASVLLFTIGVLVFGMFISLRNDPDQMTVTFMVLLFVAPLLFTEKPSRINVLVILAVIAYAVLDKQVKTEEIYGKDLVNVFSYGFLSLFVSSFLIHVKMKAYYLEAVNERLVHIDSLTGIYNRYSFENAVAGYEKDFSDRDITFVALDVNRLKYANDRMGHLAGDELLKGAAGCIESVFGKIGKCYRIGGDEFEVILENCPETEEELARKLADATAGWKGELVEEVSISMGLANNRRDQTCNIKELIKRADEKMYASKREFYEKHGYDRRLNTQDRQ